MKTQRNALNAAMYLHPAKDAMIFRIIHYARSAAKSKTWIRLKDFFFCALAMLSLGAAGSDGPWFPWPNFAGVGILMIMAVVVTIKGDKR